MIETYTMIWGNFLLKIEQPSKYPKISGHLAQPKKCTYLVVTALEGHG